MVQSSIVHTLSVWLPFHYTNIISHFLLFDCMLWIILSLQMLMNVYCRQTTAAQMLTVLTQRVVIAVPATLATQEMD